MALKRVARLRKKVISHQPAKLSTTVAFKNLQETDNVDKTNSSTLWQRCDNVFVFTGLRPFSRLFLILKT